jgi:hypothetical protein
MTLAKKLASFAATIASTLWVFTSFAGTESTETPTQTSTATATPTSTSTSTATASMDTGGSSSTSRVPTDDPTGGAYTSPTLLFIPAAAVPKWNARVVASTELQSPSDVHAGFRPGLGAELGLPFRFTIGAGTNWVGGDINPSTGRDDFNLGLSPYLQARGHILGRADGQGFQLGAATIYKFVGFEGDPGEIELAISSQYRQSKYELGLQGVIGQDFGDPTHHDGELHAYAVYRVIPQLALGAAGQVRIAIAPPMSATASAYDVIGGAIASLTLGRYQLGALAGASTLGLDQGHAGGLGQLFGSVRF